MRNNMQSLKHKSNLIFYQLVGIGLAFLWLVVFIGTNLYPKLFLIGGSLMNKLETICGCANHWSYFTHPIMFSLIVAAGLILSALIALAVIRIFKLDRATRKFIRFNLQKRRRQVSYKLAGAAESIGLKGKLAEIRSKQPIVFCYGFIEPKICISEALVRELSQEELLAVLKHEEHHLAAREPMKIFISKIISKTLFFIPAVKLLTQKYQTLLELAADESATEGFKNKAPLAGALEKVLRLKEDWGVKNSLGVSFFGVIDDRVNRLTNDSYEPSLKVFSLKSLGLLLVVFVLIASFYIPVYSSESAMAGHGGGSCVEKSQTIVGDECQMTLDKDSCRMDESGVERTLANCDNQLSLNQSDLYF